MTSDDVVCARCEDASAECVCAGCGAEVCSGCSVPDPDYFARLCSCCDGIEDEDESESEES